MKIPNKYKIPLVGEYNPAISICPECGLNLLPWDDYGCTDDNTIGFADTDDGLMAVIECPRCFTKWYFHGDSAMGSHIPWFLESVKEGDNKHFNI